MEKNLDTLWTSQEAAAVVGGDVHAPWQATGVSINTRTLRAGDVFVALQGPHADGHDWVTTAFEKGASAALVCHRPPVLDPDAPVLVVNDTMKALQALGAGARHRLDHARVIAVTGSVGKTGVKEALKRVLSAQGKTAASEGNLNNQWGLPLSLARIPGDVDFAVLELGMNHAGELTALSRIARPHVCVITTIAPAHTEFFTSTQAIADAKAEIFAGAAPGAHAVLNRDIAEFERLSAAAEAANMGRITTFGSDGKADFRLLDCHLRADGSEVTATTPAGQLSYRLAVPGYHWVINSLCVLASVFAAGGDVEQAAQDLAGVAAPAGRGARLEIATKGGTFLLIDESYNASPASMGTAIAVLAAQPVGPNGRRIAVLGDMLELGEDAPNQHARLNEVLAAHDIDRVFLAGDAMHHLWSALPGPRRGAYERKAAALAAVLCPTLRAGDVVMVKGSAGVHMGRVLAALKGLDISHLESSQLRAGEA